jgi:hypothetical protein
MFNIWADDSPFKEENARYPKALNKKLFFGNINQHSVGFCWRKIIIWTIGLDLAVSCLLQNDKFKMFGFSFNEFTLELELHPIKKNYSAVIKYDTY